MSYAFMNGRLRIHANSTSSMLSLIPSCFPQLICSLPLIENKLNPCKDSLNDGDILQISADVLVLETLNIQGVKRWKDRVVVDHCWETSASVKIPMLAVLSRPRIMQNELNQVLINGYTTSTVHLQWNENTDDKNDTGSIDSQFQSELVINFPFLGCNIMFLNGLLVIGTSTGAIAYHASDLMLYHEKLDSPKSEVSFDQVRHFPLMKTFSIDAMDMNGDYFVAVSGDRLGVWRIDDLKNACLADTAVACEALWTTKLSGRERITCVKITDQIIALSSWDGSAFIYCRESSSEWIRVSHDVEDEYGNWERPNLKWEHEYSPTIISILACDQDRNSSSDVSFALSSPNSADIRIFDIRQKRLLRRISKQSGQTIQGMICFQNKLFALNDLDHITVFEIKL